MDMVPPGNKRGCSSVAGDLNLLSREVFSHLTEKEARLETERNGEADKRETRERVSEGGRRARWRRRPGARSCCPRKDSFGSAVTRAQQGQPMLPRTQGTDHPALSFPPQVPAFLSLEGASSVSRHPGSHSLVPVPSP